MTYGPLAIALAQGALASEYAEYAHVTGMRRGAIRGIWNGRVVSLPAPFGSADNDNRWRPLIRTVLYALVTRVFGAIAAYGVFLWLDLPFAGLAALVCFIWGPVLGSLAWGHTPRPEVDKAIQVLGVMQDVYFTTWGSYVPVAALRYAMMTSTYTGIVWPESLWRLVDTATMSKRILWMRERRGHLW